MHRVDRGPEPAGLAAVREAETPKWVKYYAGGRKKPKGKWTQFQPELAERFHGNCGYCEAGCRGEVDHFRPKSGFPERVYNWNNWVLACHDCNWLKGSQWPRDGYVDPCARRKSDRPEEYFTYDTVTCQIVPRRGLTALRKRRAQTMIDDLGLNRHHHLSRRTKYLKVIREACQRLGGGERDRAVIAVLISRDMLDSSLVRVWLQQNPVPGLTS